MKETRVAHFVDGSPVRLKVGRDGVGDELLKVNVIGTGFVPPLRLPPLDDAHTVVQP